MQMGFASGAILGGVCGLGAVMAVSVLSDLPNQPDVAGIDPAAAVAPLASQAPVVATPARAELVAQNPRPVLPVAGRDPAPRLAAIRTHPGALVPVIELPRLQPAGADAPLPALLVQPHAAPQFTAQAALTAPGPANLPGIDLVAARPALPEPVLADAPLTTRSPARPQAEHNAHQPRRPVQLALAATDMPPEQTATTPRALQTRIGTLTTHPDQAQPGRLPHIEPDEKRAEIIKPADPAEKPLFSVVLLDGGGDPDDLDLLRDAGFAISVAIDARSPDAPRRTAAFRAGGHDVLALLDLPENLTPADAEILVTAALHAVPGAVGLLEGQQSGLSGKGPITEQVIDIARANGLGLIWQAKGPPRAHQQARTQGLGSQILLRDVDSAGQNGRAVRRFLDHAAFTARQQKGGVVIGRLRPETIDALLLWRSKPRAQKLTLAPVSALLDRH